MSQTSLLVFELKTVPDYEITLRTGTRTPSTNPSSTRS